MKKIFFDMDGTIANLYSVDNWLNKLIASDPSPYADAKPMLNFSRLARSIHKLQRKGYKIGIISWTSKNGTDEYNAAVAQVKKEWLAKHLSSVKWDEIHIVAYGTPKSTVGKTGILFDDEQRNRDEWTCGSSYPPEEIFEVMKGLA